MRTLSRVNSVPKTNAEAVRPPAERRAIRESLREQLLERNYIQNLLATIEREAAAVG